MSYYYRNPWYNVLAGAGAKVAGNIMDLLTDKVRDWVDIPTDAQRLQREKDRRETILRTAASSPEAWQQAAPQLEEELKTKLPRVMVGMPTEEAKALPGFWRTGLKPGQPGGLSFPDVSPITEKPLYEKKEQFAPYVFPVETQLAALAQTGALDPRYAKARAPIDDLTKALTIARIQKTVQDMQQNQELFPAKKADLEARPGQRQQNIDLKGQSVNIQGQNLELNKQKTQAVIDNTRSMITSREFNDTIKESKILSDQAQKEFDNQIKTFNTSKDINKQRDALAKSIGILSKSHADMSAMPGGKQNPYLSTLGESIKQLQQSHKALEGFGEQIPQPPVKAPIPKKGATPKAQSNFFDTHELVGYGQKSGKAQYRRKGDPNAPLVYAP